MPAPEQTRKVAATNRRARHDYTIESTLEAGLVLVGTEVKSLRIGGASLMDAHAATRALAAAVARNLAPPPGTVS